MNMRRTAPVLKKHEHRLPPTSAQHAPAHRSRPSKPGNLGTDPTRGTSIATTVWNTADAGGMKVDKLSVSFEPDLGDAVRSAAAQAGKPVSSWLAEAAAGKLRAEARADFLSGWEAEHGVLTVGEVARAERELGLSAAICRVSAVILDAGALVAVDRNDRAMIARLQASSSMAWSCGPIRWSSLKSGATGMVAR